MRRLSAIAQRRLEQRQRGAEPRPDPPSVDWGAVRRARELECRIAAQVHRFRGMPFQRAPRLRVQDIDLG